MTLKVASYISFVIILLILLEVVGAAVTASPTPAEKIATVHSKRSSTSAFDFLLFEKAEEEAEKSEKEKNGADRPMLVDFSWVAQSLSLEFTPKINLTPFTFFYNVGPPVYERNCTFLI